MATKKAAKEGADPAAPNFVIETFEELPKASRAGFAMAELAYPVDKLEIGQRFRVGAFDEKTEDGKKILAKLRNCAQSYGKREKRTLLVRKDGDGLWGVYRTEYVAPTPRATSSDTAPGPVTEVDPSTVEPAAPAPVAPAAPVAVPAPAVPAAAVPAAPAGVDVGTLPV